MPSAASMAHCATFPNASLCNADSACQFVDNLACKAVDTDCAPLIHILQLPEGPATLCLCVHATPQAGLCTLHHALCTQQLTGD